MSNISSGGDVGSGRKPSKPGSKLDDSEFSIVLLPPCGPPPCRLCDSSDIMSKDNGNGISELPSQQAASKRSAMEVLHMSSSCHQRQTQSEDNVTVTKTTSSHLNMTTR
eukprot:sb/3477474/